MALFWSGGKYDPIYNEIKSDTSHRNPAEIVCGCTFKSPGQKVSFFMEPW